MGCLVDCATWLLGTATLGRGACAEDRAGGFAGGFRVGLVLGCVVEGGDCVWECDVGEVRRALALGGAHAVDECADCGVFEGIEDLVDGDFESFGDVRKGEVGEVEVEEVVDLGGQ